MLLQILPVIAYAAVAAVILWLALAKSGPASWALPAVVAAAFAGFSVITVAREGLLQFWVNHSTTFAGNQVWFDLLLAVTLCFALIVPRARAVGMPLVPWAVAVILTASIALVPMMARLLWLERRAKRT